MTNNFVSIKSNQKLNFITVAEKLITTILKKIVDYNDN